MEKALPDSELDQLVGQLNQLTKANIGATKNTAALPTAAEALGQRSVISLVEGDTLDQLLAELIDHAASDLYMIAGVEPTFRVDGRLIRSVREPMTAGDIQTSFGPYLSDINRTRLNDRGSADFTMHRFAGDGLSGRRNAWRFRINLHYQRGNLAAAIRALPRRIPTLEELNLPASMIDLVESPRGLILLCGPTGSGKTSTLASLIGKINGGRTCHIVTIEDPVEYEHQHRQSIIEHVEVGRDAPSFAEALRAALRQDPDVILVGEMRDLETIATALTAAETGHLILSTLHTNDVVQAIHRIVDVFPPVQQLQIRQQLALSLNAVVAQQLIPRENGEGRVPAVEILKATHPVRVHIRNEKTQMLYQEIALGKRFGMISLEESLANLVQAGTISMQEAQIRTSRPEDLKNFLKIGSR